MRVTDDDVLLVRTMVAAIREHYGVLAADDRDALDELLRDAGDLLGRMNAEVPASAANPAGRADAWDDIPL